METSLKTGFAQISLAARPNNLSCPKYGGLQLPQPLRPVRLWSEKYFFIELILSAVPGFLSTEIEQLKDQKLFSVGLLPKSNY